MDIIEFTRKFKNHPVLFLGTGFSLRYLETSYTWESLLAKIAYDVTGSEETYLDIKSRSQKEDKTFCYELIAEEIEKLFNELLSNDRNGKFKEVNDKFYSFMKYEINYSRFKIYISMLLSELKITQEKQSEINAIKKIKKNISSIITTNYDKLAEVVFEFNPLIGNDILLSNPYGSIYKIHGCISQPDSIIITNEDYKVFSRKYELIRAQLLSLFIHNPIIFIGYSMNDNNIRKLLKTIFTYIPHNSVEAEKIKENFLIIEYERDSTNLDVQEHDIVLDDFVTIQINKIKTDNFEAIYDALGSLQLSISAMDIRKVQSIVKTIYEGGDIKVEIVDDLDSLTNDQKILAISNSSRYTYTYFTSKTLLSTYFKVIEEENCQQLQLIDKMQIQPNQYFPIFAFSKMCPNIERARDLKKQQKLKIESISFPTTCMTKKCSIDEVLADHTISPTNKPLSIIYNILKKSIALEDVYQYLNTTENKDHTDYRKILCVYDFVKYGNELE